METKSRTFALTSCFIAIFGCVLMLVFGISHSYWGGFSISTSLGLIDAYGEDMQAMITTVNIDKYENLDNLPLLSKCTGLETININRQNMSDFSAFNNLSSYKDIYVYINGSVVDLKDLSSRKITSLSISTSFVKNIKAIENLTNLTYLRIDTVSDYEDIDFSKLTKLDTLIINGVYINDFDNLFNSIPNVVSLNLDSTNLNDENIGGIVNVSKLAEFSCLYTNITDLDVFKGMNNLGRLSLPYSVEDVSDIYELTNINYFKITSSIDSENRALLTQYFKDNGINYYIYDTKQDFNRDDLIQDLIHLAEQLEDLEEPEYDDPAIFNYILTVINSYNPIMDKYLEHPDHDVMLFSSLYEFFEEYRVGYGIVIENGDFYKKIFHVVKDYDGNYHYLIADDENPYDAVLFNDYNSFEGNMISFINPDLYKFIVNKILMNYDEYDTKDDYLVNILENTSLEELIESLGSSYEVKVYSNNELKSSGLIGTGDVVQFYDDTTLVAEFVAVVKGDTTGDGIVNMGDLNKLYYYIENIIAMDGAYLESSELVLNDNVDIGDLNKLYYYVLNIIDTL